MANKEHIIFKFLTKDLW